MPPERMSAPCVWGSCSRLTLPPRSKVTCVTVIFDPFAGTGGLVFVAKREDHACMRDWNVRARTRAKFY